jgi:hypothetical protein
MGTYRIRVYLSGSSSTNRGRRSRARVLREAPRRMPRRRLRGSVRHDIRSWSRNCDHTVAGHRRACVCRREEVKNAPIHRTYGTLRYMIEAARVLRGFRVVGRRLATLWRDLLGAGGSGLQAGRGFPFLARLDQDCSRLLLRGITDRVNITAKNPSCHALAKCALSHRL